MNSVLVDFYKSIAKEIENDIVTEEQLFELGEFYREYKFKEEMASSKTSDKKELIKFLSLGWFIYSTINGK